MEDQAGEVIDVLIIFILVIIDPWYTLFPVALRVSIMNSLLQLCS